MFYVYSARFRFFFVKHVPNFYVAQMRDTCKASNEILSNHRWRMNKEPMEREEILVILVPS